MRVHTQGFKDQIKKMGREIDSRITYGDNVLTSEELYGIYPIVNGGLLKSAMKELQFESSVQVPNNTIIKYEFGLKVDGEYEYLDYGNYIVYSSEFNEDTKTYKHTCYDSMLFSMKEYTTLQSGTFPMTVREYLTNLCLDCNLVFKNSNDTFANYDKIIETDLYANLDYTYRDIFDELSAVTASTICLNSDEQVEVRYVTETNDTIDAEYLKDVNVKFGEKYGPINSIVLSRSAESDNVYLGDEESVTTNGLCELKIIDNQIMNDNNRSDFLSDILTKLNGLEYYINDYTSTGILYYEICDKYHIQIDDKIYDCILLNDEPEITQGIVENIFTEMPEETKSDYTKSDKTDRKLNKAYIIVDKQNQQIETLTSSISNLDVTVNNNIQEINKKFDDYVPESDFVTLENSVTQLQTDTYTKTEINTKLTDGSVTKVKTTSLVADDNGLTIDKSGSKTKGNLDADGLTVIDKTGATESELLFAGYDEVLGETVVRTNNIKIIKYTDIGTHSRIQDYEEGTGIFIL